MKKVISLLLCSLLLLSLLPMGAVAEGRDEWICSDCRIWVSGAYCPQCAKARPAAQPAGDECMMTFRLTFRENAFFSRYDAEILINGETAFTVEHGGTLDGTVVVPCGDCELVFRNASNPAEDLRFSLILTEDTTFSAELSAHFYGLEMGNVTCSALLGNQELAVGQAGTRNGARMTVLSVTNSRGNGINVPAEGYTFVWVEFEVCNTMNHALLIYPEQHFSIYCDGYTIQTSARAEAAAPMSFANRLDAGEKMRAMLCFELPVNWQEMTIVFGDEDAAFDRLVYVIHN